jgi:hypothetical protein
MLSINILEGTSSTYLPTYVEYTTLYFHFPLPTNIGILCCLLYSLCDDTRRCPALQPPYLTVRLCIWRYGMTYLPGLTIPSLMAFSL